MNLVQTATVRSCSPRVASCTGHVSRAGRLDAIHLWMGFGKLVAASFVDAILIGVYSTADLLIGAFGRGLCLESGRDRILVIVLEQVDEFGVVRGDSS